MMGVVNKPFSQACENNKGPILSVLENIFSGAKSVLEIGSGTGQHAVHFASHLQHLTWQTSDLKVNHEGIQAWLDEAGLPNLIHPVEIDVQREKWPCLTFDAAYTANTAHIMSWPMVEDMFAGVARRLPENGIFCIYGPFNYGGQYTSESNRLFDQSLKGRSPSMGIRDFEMIEKLAGEQGMLVRNDISMPANNRLLAIEKVFQPSC